MIERKVAIITGSGTGVGAATALLLSKQGYNVLINYSRSETEAQASQADCQAAGAGSQGIGKLGQFDVGAKTDAAGASAKPLYPAHQFIKKINPLRTAAKRSQTP